MARQPIPIEYGELEDSEAFDEALMQAELADGLLKVACAHVGVACDQVEEECDAVEVSFGKRPL